MSLTGGRLNARVWLDWIKSRSL